METKLSKETDERAVMQAKIKDMKTKPICQTS